MKKLSNSKHAIWEYDSNNLCIISGKTTITFFLGMILPRVRFLSPTAVMNRMLFGTITDDIYGGIDYYPSRGWVFTLGQKGIKS
ncbi:MAG: hypothetical protein JSW60_08800 [Thermoplasmatales archaeon]|nr:MAG: hypothetical protein JSW60_08800 [Thermoplasmatales archaeon]